MGLSLRQLNLCKPVVAAAFFSVFLCHAVASWGAKNNFDLTLAQTSYSGAPLIAEQNNQYFSVIPKFEISKQWGAPEETNSLVRGNGFAVLAVSDSSDFGWAIPELYYQKTYPHTGFSFSIGRKKESWSELDRHWNLGLWQPLVRWDAANPVEQGLTGAFLQFEKGAHVRANLLVSGLFLPDQQPNYEEKNGRIVSANRWFPVPPQQANFNNFITDDIFYSVHEPRVSDVIFQNSYAGQLFLGNPNVGLFASAAVADKPANQFQLILAKRSAFDMKKSNSEDETPYMSAVYPKAIRHKLYTFESGYRWEHSRVVLSANWEEYENLNLSSDWELTPPPADSRYDGVIWTQSLSPLGFKRKEITVSYVHREIGYQSQKSRFIKGDEVDALAQRFQFEEMIGVELQANILRTYKRELDVHAKYVYSLGDQGEWVQAGLQFQHDRKWVWEVAGDVFGVPEETKANTSFISKFRGNDRITGSLTYVF